MINLLKWLPALATALAMLLAQRSLMHDFQLESYQFPGYFRTLRRNWKRALLPGRHAGGVLDAAVFGVPER